MSTEKENVQRTQDDAERDRKGRKQSAEERPDPRDEEQGPPDPFSGASRATNPIG